MSKILINDARKIINEKILRARYIDDPADGKIISLTAIKELGAGSFAKVLLLRERDSERLFAARISTNRSETERNIYSHIMFAKYSMAPRIYAVFYGAQSHFILMDVIDITLHEAMKTRPPELFKEAITCLLNKKYLIGALHGDMHTDNIVILKDGQTLGFIDFDFTLFDVPRIVNILDFIPLIGSIKAYPKRGIKLIESLLTYYKKTFNIDINYSLVKSVHNMGYGYKVTDPPINSYMAIFKESYIPLAVLKKVFTGFKAPQITK